MSSLVFYKYDFIFLQSVSQTRKAHALYGNWTLRLWDTSPTGQFAYCLVILPTGHFAYWSFRQRDISPTGHFAYWTVRPLDISPTAWTVCLQILGYTSDFILLW